LENKVTAVEIAIASYIVINYDQKMKSCFCMAVHNPTREQVLINLGKVNKISDFFRVKVFLLPVFVYFLTKPK